MGNHSFFSGSLMYSSYVFLLKLNHLRLKKKCSGPKTQMPRPSDAAAVDQPGPSVGGSAANLGASTDTVMSLMVGESQEPDLSGEGERDTDDCGVRGEEGREEGEERADDNGVENMHGACEEQVSESVGNTEVDTKETSDGEKNESVEGEERDQQENQRRKRNTGADGAAIRRTRL